MAPDPAQKSVLRRDVRARLEESPFVEGGFPMASWLVSSLLFRDAEAVVGYAAIQKEVSVQGILERAILEGKALLLPRWCAEAGAYELVQVGDLARDLVGGRYGIQEPRPGLPSVEELPGRTLWLIPGLAFDAAGNRLGRGGGFYDRLLERFPVGVTVGVCLPCQLVKRVPVEAHDRRVDAVMTTQEWFSDRDDISL